MTFGITRGRLLAGAALGLGLAVFTPTQAEAACVVNPAASPVTGTVVCGTTNTLDTTYPVNAATGRDREYLVDTSAGDVTGTVSAAAIVDGFGLAFTNTVGGANDLFVVNNGSVTITGPAAAAAGGTAALDITGTGATNVDYSGTGSITNNSATGSALSLNTAGTGNLTATVGGNVANSDSGSFAILANHTGTAGNVSVTTATGTTIRSPGGGPAAQISNAVNAGNVTVVNNATIGSPIATPNTIIEGIRGLTAGTGAVSITNNGTMGATGDRVTTWGINGGISNALSTADLTINGTGAIFSSGIGILANNAGTGTTTINYTGAINTTGPTGVSVTASTGPTIVTTGAVTAATDAVDVTSTGTQTITLNGVTTGTAGSGVVSDTTAARTIAVGVAGNVTGGAQAILLENTGTATITNATTGTIGAAATGLAINAAAAGATTITNAGTINGRVTLSGFNDTLTNTGRINAQGTLDFGAGADTFANTSSAGIAGIFNLTGATTLANLETFTNTGGRINLNTFTLTGPAIAFNNTGTIDTNGSAGIAGFTTFSNAGTLDLAAGTFTTVAGVFTNTGTILADEGAATITGQTSFANSGTIDLQDNVIGDVLTINSDFVGSGGSNLDIDFSGAGADRLVITGAASGATAVDANYLGGFDLDGVLVVDTGTSTAGAFTLGTVSGDTPLVDVSLQRVGQDFFLVAAPNEATFSPLVVPGFAMDMWYQSADEVFAETVKPATTVGLSFWGEGYISSDKYGSDDENVVINDVEFEVDNELDTDRHGLQLGIDYGFDIARVGLTGGYAHAKAEGNANADLRARGWNAGVYGQYGGVMGFHGEVLAKYDRYNGEFEDGPFDGEDFDIKSVGADAAVGYRFGFGGSATMDAHAGVSYVKTKLENIDTFGFEYDFDDATSTRGRAGIRAILGGGLAPYIDGTVYHEFSGDRDVELFDGLNTHDLGTSGKGTWGRIEGGLSGNDGPGPILALWGDFGDRKGFGLRAGWRLGGRVAEALPPPPPPPAPPPPPPPATQTCPDGSVILATDACPPPPPPPPPPPEPERG